MFTCSDLAPDLHWGLYTLFTFVCLRALIAMASFPLKPGEELELERCASFENRDGTLGLTNVHVFFQTPVGQQIIIPLVRIKSMILCGVI